MGKIVFMWILFYSKYFFNYLHNLFEFRLFVFKDFNVNCLLWHFSGTYLLFFLFTGSEEEDDEDEDISLSAVYKDDLGNNKKLYLDLLKLLHKPFHS